MKIRFLSLAFCLFTTLLVSASSAAEKLKLLIVDGQNNHNWAAMTPPMKATLEETGRFEVEVATTPAANEPAEKWDAFRPEFDKYDAVLSNYNGQLWPEAVQEDLEEFVKGGKGLVIIHAANNAFPEWGEWNKMIGLGWRDAKYGDRLTLNNEGGVVRTKKGDGPGAGHGPQHAFEVVIRDKEHPVTKGMPRAWLHATDELYHGQRGPAADMQVLATAYSAPDKGGTDAHEPMIWVIPYGKGRVFTTVMGHVMGEETTAIRCVGFQSVMCRGAEWAATGEVTLPIPEKFPTMDEISLVETN